MSTVPERVLKLRKAWAESDAKRDEGNKEPDSIIAYKNIPYSDNGEFGLLDVYRPKAEKGILPVIVNVHGGGYFYGCKEIYKFYCMHLAESGFAVVNFNYRLSPENHFPAALEDIVAVINWIASKANEYGFDLDRVCMIGDSAGAQLASQYGAIHTNPEYAEAFKFSIPGKIKLKALGLACGMYDLKKRLASESAGTMVEDYLGPDGDINDPRHDCLSYITKDYPASYVFSSYEDFLLPDCEPMKDYLKSKGIDAESHIYGEKGKTEIGHVFHVNMKLEEGKKANEDQIAFFKKHI